MANNSIGLAFPREKSRGLIEADMRRGRIDAAGDRFRGRNPAASLKRGHVSDSGGGHKRFPREKSRGLIEADAGNVARQRKAAFPREKSRGLIEAAREISPATRPASVSAGEIPRPH